LINKIISGGQSGVDRAALDAAISLRINHGGWCPNGRKAEDGTIDSIYVLQETESSDYRLRTRLNVSDSDATLILYNNELEGGTRYTWQCAHDYKKPVKLIDLQQDSNIGSVLEWLGKEKINTLNIAGPRSSKQPEIYQQAYNYLIRLLSVVPDSG